MDLTMSYVQRITPFLFPLHTAYPHQINLLKNVLPILFSSSKSSLTPHSHRSSIQSHLKLYTHHVSLPLYFDSCPSSLQCSPTFSKYSARFILSLASPWDSPKSPKPMVHFSNPFYHQSIIPSILSFSKLFLSTYYESHIALESEETNK